MAAVHTISDDWEEVPDDDTFSMVSTPSSDHDTVLVPRAQRECTNTPQQHRVHSPQEIPTSSALSSPSTPMGTPRAFLPMVEAHSRSHPALSSLNFLATPTELSPPYLDIDTEAYMSASHLDGLLDNRGDGSSHLDSALAVNRVGVDTSTHLCSLAMVESARSEIVRFTTNELAPLRARLGQQILEVCFKLGKQVESLHAILSSFESDWDPESAGSYFDPALEEWLHCVKQVLVAMQAETESVALHSLDMDKDTRDDVVDGKTEEFLQCFYVRLVDHTDKMDNFLPIMILYAAPLST